MACMCVRQRTSANTEANQMLQMVTPRIKFWAARDFASMDANTTPSPMPPGLDFWNANAPNTVQVILLVISADAIRVTPVRAERDIEQWLNQLAKPLVIGPAQRYGANRPHQGPQANDSPAVIPPDYCSTGSSGSGVPQCICVAGDTNKFERQRPQQHCSEPGTNSKSIWY